MLTNMQDDERSIPVGAICPGTVAFWRRRHWQNQSHSCFYECKNKRCFPAQFRLCVHVYSPDSEWTT
ncbi:hypothetical protein CEXT_189591 [Caerostris extrusa]|uniref:Uncharacterized protein n=1 Tax=Caerostris extrusa TaxID=172846 RepID=A0AAV4X0Z2_CAEEX|nr:hypothetical protein CEXT_189591 [Caerostris extrusa]